MNMESETPQAIVGRRFDPLWYLMFGIIVGTTIWLLGLPFCKFEQQSLLNRFHLQTKSFGVWCLQQPIPAMYNGYNRFESRQGSIDSNLKSSGTINHFPIRLLTFGDNRDLFLSEDDPTIFDAWTSYRGSSIHTRWTAKPSLAGHQLTDEVLP